jgi:DNA topoisomerase-2
MLVRWLEGNDDALNDQIPVYFEGFKGAITGGDAASGVYTKIKEDEFLVTELPPGTWTQDYREWLEKELTEGRINDFVDTSTDKDVHIVIRGIHVNDLQKSLYTQFRKTNMHAFNSKGVITKYERPNDILKEFAEVRLSLYEKRRLHTIQSLENELPYHANVVRFIQDQIADVPKIVLKKKTRAECDVVFLEHKFAKIENSYDFLMKLPISSFTAEEIAKHEKKLLDLKSEIARLQGLDAADMWLNELNAL